MLQNLASVRATRVVGCLVGSLSPAEGLRREKCRPSRTETYFLRIASKVFQLEGVLQQNSDEFSNANDIYEAIGDILVSSSDGIGESDIMDLCCSLADSISENRDKSRNVSGPRKKLDGPVQMTRELASAAGFSDYNVKEEPSMWTATRGLTVVDSKKLGKAEAKLKSKQEKRVQQTITPVSSTSSLENFATANQVISRKDVRLESKGRNNATDVKLENVDVSFGENQLLVDANLTLVYGRRYGLVGRNGLGKTTLLKMISSGSLRIPSKISILHVEQEVNGDETLVLESVLECDDVRRNLLVEEARIQLELSVEQSAGNQQSLVEKLKQVFEDLTAIEADKAPSRAAAILYGLGFDSKDQKRPTKEFSGGWRMRLALARALFLRPDLLLLDEPTNMLDIKAIYWLENYLQTWKSTLLVVSHDRKFLNEVTTDIVHLHSKRLDYYAGNYDIFERTKTEKLKNQRKEYEAQQQLREHVQVFIDRFRYNANRAALVQSKIKMLERLPELKPVETESDVVWRFAPCEKLNPPVLQMDEVGFAYAPNSVIFDKCILNADMDSRICIVGENGAGKTTLLKLLLGDLHPTKGLRQAHRLLKMAYFTQHHVDQLVMDVSSLQFVQSKFPGQPVETYRAALGRFGLSGELALQSVASLSGGQKSRLAFATIGLQSPNFLVLDEPTNHLDVETVEALGTALNEFPGGVVLVSHDERLIEIVCKELWVVKDQAVRRLEGGLAEYKEIIERELAAQK